MRQATYFDQKFHATFFLAADAAGGGRVTAGARPAAAPHRPGPQRSPLALLPPPLDPNTGPRDPEPHRMQPGLAPHPRGAGAVAGTPAKPAGDQVDQRRAAAAGCPDEDQTGEVWGAGGPARDQSDGGAAAGACFPSKVHVDGRGGAGVCVEPKAHGREGEAACALDADLSGHRGVRGQPRWGLQPPESARGQAPDPGAMQNNDCRISGDAEGRSLAEKTRNALETSSAAPDSAVQEAAEAHRRLRETIDRQSAVMWCACLAAKHPACSPSAGLVKSQKIRGTNR